MLYLLYKLLYTNMNWRLTERLLYLFPNSFRFYSTRYTTNKKSNRRAVRDSRKPFDLCSYL